MGEAKESFTVALCETKPVFVSVFENPKNGYRVIRVRFQNPEQGYEPYDTKTGQNRYENGQNGYENRENGYENPYETLRKRPFFLVGGTTAVCSNGQNGYENGEGQTGPVFVSYRETPFSLVSCSATGFILHSSALLLSASTKIPVPLIARRRMVCEERERRHDTIGLQMKLNPRLGE